MSIWTVLTQGLVLVFLILIGWTAALRGLKLPQRSRRGASVSSAHSRYGRPAALQQAIASGAEVPPGVVERLLSRDDHFEPAPAKGAQGENSGDFAHGRDVQKRLAHAHSLLAGRREQRDLLLFPSHADGTSAETLALVRTYGDVLGGEVETYEAAYGGFDGWETPADYRENFYLEVHSALLRPGRRFKSHLSVACGPGNFERVLAQAGVPTRVAFDTSEFMIDEARKRDPGANVHFHNAFWKFRIQHKPSTLQAWVSHLAIWTLI